MGDLHDGKAPSQKSRSRASRHSQKEQQMEQFSNTTSQAPRSVYLGGNEKDEWAIIMKFDTELYKKE